MYTIFNIYQIYNQTCITHRKMDFTSFCIQTIYIRPKLSEKNPLSNFRSKFTTLFFLFQQLEKKGNKDDNNEYKNTLL
ncbi:hypothetical protein B0191_17185 [Leptospira interrogans serovar Hardjo]|nr:hypothetical protein B0191_17185 [Leptospira interrogans serovar Hardjo]